MEPLRHVFDTVEFGGFLKCQQIAELIGALDALFEEDGIAINGYGSDAQFYSVVVRVRNLDHSHDDSPPFGQRPKGQS